MQAGVGGLQRSSLFDTWRKYTHRADADRRSDAARSCSSHVSTDEVTSCAQHAIAGLASATRETPGACVEGLPEWFGDTVDKP